ncbi:MAG: carbohydrate binding domain-containing protein [Planctomycetaceae bacterium]|nr:carbohydrate binding domain-containing protein [Planctomycetaceae bacterium]
MQNRWIILLAVFFCGGLLYADANVLINSGFENGTSDWLDRNCSIETVSSPVHSGSSAGRTFDRTDTWQGIRQSMMDKMVVGQTYQISGWVRLENAASATVKLTVEKTDGSGTTYPFSRDAAVTNSAWVQISGVYTLNVSGTLTGLYVYFEGPPSGVSFFVDDVSVYGPTPPPVTTTTHVDPGIRHQTIEGIGAAGGWYGGWLTAHPQKAALYNLLFHDLGLDIYRIRNTYGIDTNNMSTDDEIITQAQAALGRPLKVMISSWSPQASLKSNGSTVAGTLAKNVSGQYRYADFAQWWLDSLNAYAALGITAEYINMQNEADYLATWDSCKFTPAETADYAGYNLAFAALADLAGSMPGAPKLLAPETVGFGSSKAYINALIDKTPLYAYAHHLYGDGSGANPDGYILGMTNYAAAYNDKPRMQTEYSSDNAYFTDAINLALLMHNSLVYESAAAYVYWDLFWETPGGLISLEWPWNPDAGYSIRPVYYAFKHYSAFIDADWQRAAASTVSPQLRTSAYISPDNRKLSVIFVNPGYSEVQTTVSFSNVSILGGQLYRTSETENCVLVGSFSPAASLVAPARSIITLSLDIEPPIDRCADVQSYGYRLPADLNGDCRVNLPDLILLSEQWLWPDPIAMAPNHSPDLVADSQIDLADFAGLCIQWLACNDPEDPSCTW